MKLKKYISENKIVTIPATVFIFLGIISVIVWRLSIKYVQVADFFAGTISFVLRFILTKITYFIPFSLAEFIIYISVPLFIFLFIKLVTAKKKWTALFKFLYRTAAVWGLLMFIFTFNFGVCYGTTPVNEKIGFERRLLEIEDLASAMQILISESREVSGNIKYVYSETGSTAMPYSLKELNKKLNEAYKNMLERHDLFKRIYSRVKPVILSEQMSKTHITGIYVPFTGEANVNIDFPDYNLPFTAAHEMAHLMGVGREDEANFVAFLVCIYSGDDYIRYSGLVSMTEYIGNALYKADKDRYYEITKELPEIISQEMAAYSRFFDKYRNTEISKVANAVNNTYLKSQGQEQGAKSYGFVVDLATVYLLDVYEKNGEIIYAEK